MFSERKMATPARFMASESVKSDQLTINTSPLREQRDRTPVNAPEALATRTPIPLSPNRMRRNASPVCAVQVGFVANPCRNFAEPCYGLRTASLPLIEPSRLFIFYQDIGYRVAFKPAVRSDNFLLISGFSGKGAS
jgi:hypothetical protein